MVQTLSSMRPRAVLLAIVALLALAACDRSPPASGAPDNIVALRLRPIADSLWEARFGPDSAPTLFRVRPSVKPFPDTAKFVFAKWTLYGVPGSNGAPLLVALAKAHHFGGQVSVTSLADSLPVNVALLAVRAARNAEGAFGPNGSGDWIAAKLFLDGKGEILLYLNPVAGLAEFTITDDQHGPDIVRELARVVSR